MEGVHSEIVGEAASCSVVTKYLYRVSTIQ